MSDEELIALAVCQAITGITSDRQFLGIVGKLLPGWFPHLPDQSQYNRRLRGLTPRMVWVQQRLSDLLASSGLRVADGTLIGVANYAGCQQRSEFAGTAAYGYCAAKSQYVWGVRLVLLTDPTGLPVGYTLVAANEKEYEPVRELTTSQAARSSPTRVTGAAATRKRSGSRASRSAPPTASVPPTTSNARSASPACAS